MPQTQEVLKDKVQTGRTMYADVKRYSHDLHSIRFGNQPLSSLSLSGMFDFLRLFPYRRDARPVEVVGRPARLLGGEFSGIDCKKKSICMASWLYLHGIPFRFIASSNRQDRKVHHVFTQGLISGEWRNLDATYSRYRPFQQKRVTHWEVLPR
jgi:hypothetical protein